MKTIISFDAASQNMGVCCMQFDDKWKDKAQLIISRANELYTTLEKLTSNETREIMLGIVKDTNDLLNNIIKITYFNTFDMIPGKKARTVPVSERTLRMKYLLTALDTKLPDPDIVIIEDQMRQNDITRSLSMQIYFHYCIIVDDILIEQKEKCVERKSVQESVKTKRKINTGYVMENSITYAVEEFPLLPVVPCTNRVPKRHVELVKPSIKNVFCFEPELRYSEFISKYSNYTANKKHTIANFKMFINLFDYDVDFDAIVNKTDDIADAFMLTYGWLLKNDLV